jgi:hypothetical protein
MDGYRQEVGDVIRSRAVNRSQNDFAQVQLCQFHNESRLAHRYLRLIAKRFMMRIGESVASCGFPASRRLGLNAC